MPMKSLLPEPPKPPAEATPPAAPDPNVAAINARIDEMRQQMNEFYRQQKGLAAPQPIYVPVPQAAAPPEPTMTEAEVLADLPGAVQRAAERQAAEQVAQLRNETYGVVKDLYDSQFNRDLDSFRSHPYWRFVGEELERHFNDPAHAGERYQKGRLQEKFHALVGAKLPEIQQAEVEAKQQAVEQRPRAVEPRIPVTSSPLSGRPPKTEAEPRLDEIREEVRQHFNQTYGLNMSAREFLAIEKREVLGPQHMSGDKTPPAELISEAAE